MKNSTHHGVYLKLHQVNDKDIIERLDEQKNKQGYIKRLIREDVAFENFASEAFKKEGDENGNQSEGET